MKAFRNRAEAGRILAERLLQYSSDRPVILALPRGGLPLAAEVAARLSAPLDILSVKKISANGYPEVAVGAVSEDGIPVFNEEMELPKSYLLSKAREKAKEVEAQVKSFRKVRPMVHIAGRLAIVVDDGLATGATMSAAVQILKKRGAAEIVVAVPVASAPAFWDIQSQVDELISLYVPERFISVGQWYEEFSQVTEEEAIALFRGQVADSSERDRNSNLAG